MEQGVRSRLAPIDNLFKIITQSGLVESPQCEIKVGVECLSSNTVIKVKVRHNFLGYYIKEFHSSFKNNEEILVSLEFYEFVKELFEYLLNVALKRKYITETQRDLLLREYPEFEYITEVGEGTHMVEDNKLTFKALAYKLWCTNDIKSILPPPDEDKIKEYNNEPVYWCTACKSLKIINAESPLKKDLKCYCGKCYGTDIVKSSIEEWEKIINKNIINNGSK